LPAALTAHARGDIEVLSRSGKFVHHSPDGGEDWAFAPHLLDRAGKYDKPVACFCIGNNPVWVLDYQSSEMFRRNRRFFFATSLTFFPTYPLKCVSNRETLRALTREAVNSSGESLPF
jgi:hypothetical protein